MDVSDYLDDLERGFRDMYNWLMEHKEQFKKQLHRFAEVEVRSIMRPTIYYGELLDRAGTPTFCAMDWTGTFCCIDCGWIPLYVLD